MAAYPFIFTTRPSLRTFALVGVCFLAAAFLIGARPARSASAAPALTNSSPMQSSARPAPELLHDVVAPAAQPSSLSSVNDSGPVGNHVRVIWMEVTAYCGCKKCCGPSAHGMTASGRSIAYNGGLFVAADTSFLPFDTQLKIPGYAGGQAVEVIDRGSAIRGPHIDVFFSSHQQAMAWGRRWLPVTIVE